MTYKTEMFKEVYIKTENTGTGIQTRITKTIGGCFYGDFNPMEVKYIRADLKKEALDDADVEILVRLGKDFVKSQYEKNKCLMPPQILPDLHLALTYLAQNGYFRTEDGELPEEAACKKSLQVRKALGGE